MASKQHHQLAKFWNVNNIGVPELLKLETAIDDILSPILEQDDLISSFGESYIKIFKIHIAVNTENYFKVDDLLALPQKANNSMSQIKFNCEQIKLQANLTEPKKVFIFTDMVANNIVLCFLDDNPPVSQNTKRSRYDVDSPELKFKGIAITITFLVTNFLRAYTPTLYIGPIKIAMINPYDFSIIYLNGKVVAPTFVIRNDDADQYKELIITDDAPASSIEEKDDISEDLIITDMYSNGGDSGGTVFSFVSPQNLVSVVGRGIILGG
ncbi:hypothetical protein C2G38_2173646 [Gigaspora rosea]|uniref:Uncharacterized protein n=1 Tax=Gigaspora rosea TaxID=44941 RepID=A0A397VL85_9GLOM|nr:hypothetical protein C2G38_2173646 [Gigaspora rosea]